MATTWPFTEVCQPLLQISAGLGFPDGSVVDNPAANEGDTRDSGSVPGSGLSPGGGDGSPLQDSCLENPTDRGAWRATVHGVAKSQTRLSTHALLCAELEARSFPFYLGDLGQTTSSPQPRVCICMYSQACVLDIQSHI